MLRRTFTPVKDLWFERATLEELILLVGLIEFYLLC
jgi:hypothetical protein